MWLHLGWGLLLVVASSLAIYPRFGMFHLQPALPALAWLACLTLDHILRSSISRLVAVGVTLGLSAFWLTWAGSAYQVVIQNDQPRQIWEYSDLVPLAEQVRQHIGSTDCVYIFPDDEATANLYYLTRCLPPSFWVFSYPWNMFGWIKDRVLQTLQDQPPEWIVYLPGRWDIERYAPEVTGYIQSHYRRVAPLHWAEGEVWLLERSP